MCFFRFFRVGSSYLGPIFNFQEIVCGVLRNISGYFLSLRRFSVLLLFFVDYLRCVVLDFFEVFHRNRRQTLCCFKIFTSAGRIEIRPVWRSSLPIWERRFPNFFGKEVLGAPFGRVPAHLFFM